MDRACWRWARSAARILAGSCCLCYVHESVSQLGVKSKCYGLMASVTVRCMTKYLEVQVFFYYNAIYKIVI
jgi:hypothetical protein